MTDESVDFDYNAELTGDKADTTQAQAGLAEVKSLLRNSGEFFIEFFLGHAIEYRVPRFHIEIWDRLIDQGLQRLLLAVPRGHAKTTLAKLAVIWYFLFTSHRFCVYLSNTNAIAKNACKDIINFLQSENFIRVFGRVNIIKESETESLWIFEIGKKRCILRALGAGQQVRGLNIDNERPDIAVADDVEDMENTDTELQQKKLDKWVFGTFIKALGKRHKLIWIGNMLGRTTLLARLSKIPTWNPIVFGCMIKDVNGHLRPLWPEVWSMEAILKDFAEYKALGLVETWMCEMMNMPGHGQNGFRQDQINYSPIPTPDSLKAAFITIDPAFGKKSNNDRTGIVVHGIPVRGPVTVCQHVNERLREFQIFQICLELSKKWGARVWGIESVAAQSVLITLFETFLAERQMINRIEIVPLKAGRGDPKRLRISSWVSMMEEGSYAIGEDDVEITTQLLNYSMVKDDQEDDLIDSCAYGPQMLENYLQLILLVAQGKGSWSNPHSQAGSEVASD